jgi:hypothetical protein
MSAPAESGKNGILSVRGLRSRLSMIRPRMLFVTRSRYWRGGNGEASRTRTLVEALAGVCELTVFFPEAADTDTSIALASRPAPLPAGGRRR